MLKSIHLHDPNFRIPRNFFQECMNISWQFSMHAIQPSDRHSHFELGAYQCIMQVVPVKSSFWTSTAK